jgi:outer membrane lipoprotein-sorting protein
LLPAAKSQGRAITLNGVLGQLDGASKSFRSLTADVSRTLVTVVVNDRSTENGTIEVRGDKMLLTMTAPDQRTFLRNGDMAYLYTPGLKQVQEYNLGANRDLADQFLELGFGTSGKSMQKGYEIKLLGEQPLGDKKDIELDLTPRSPGVLSQIAKVQIWLDTATWLPDQQQITQPSGDYSIIRYTKVVRNSNVPDSVFKPHWPKGTQRLKQG